MKMLFGVRSDFSLGESIIQMDRLVDTAAKGGVTHIALADTMTVSGMADFSRRCAEKKIEPIIGCRLRIVPTLAKVKYTEWETHYPKVFPRDEKAMEGLFELLTGAYSETQFYYVPRISQAQFQRYCHDYNVVVTTGDIYSAHHGSQALIDEMRGWSPNIPIFHEIVPSKTLYWETLNRRIYQNIKKTWYGLRFIATYPAFYVTNEEATSRDVLIGIIRNHKFHDKDPKYGAGPVPINQVRNFSLEQAIQDAGEVGHEDLVKLIDYRFKKMPVSLPQMSPNEYLTLVEECKKGWRNRFGMMVLGHRPQGTDGAVYKKRLEYELGVIKKMGFERYFLIVQDLVNYAKTNGILVGPGRGSVGGSLVAYLIGITDVDPIRFNLLFERFINPDRIDLPDADLDFASSGREKVIQYLTDKYGAESVAGITNFSTMQAAGALRDVGRVLDVPERDLSVTKLVPKEHGISYTLERAADEVAPIEEFKDKYPHIWKYATDLEGCMRSFGRHAAGVVIGGEPLIKRGVVETHRGEPVVNWDKRDVEDFGLVKIDVLGLSTLDVIGLACRYVRERTGKELNLLEAPLDDEKTLKAFGQGKTHGVFQFESGGMRKLLKDLAFERTLTFEDLVAATSLYRPGPKESGLLDDYVAIKQGLRRPFYEHPNLKPALEMTEGVIIYQEQVMQLSRDLCGFSMTKADHMRKAMGKKDKEKMEKLRAEFVSGAETTSGMDPANANALFDKILNFAAYGFNRSHAVEYSVISYWCMYLKVYYPAEFFAATLSILKEDKLEGLVRDALNYKIRVLPPDINISSDRFEIVDGEEETLLYAPFNRCLGISDKTAHAIMGARKGAPISSLKDLDRIPGRLLNVRHKANLEAVGAFAGIVPGSLAPMHPDRRKAQLELLPGLIVETLKADRAIPTDGPIKQELIRQVIAPVKACENCSLKGGVHPIPRLGKKAKFMVVTDCPNYSEESSAKMLSGKASNFLVSAMQHAKLSVTDGYFTSLVKSPKSASMLTNEQINGCKGWLQKEIEILKPPVIIALGSNAARYFLPELKNVGEHTGRAIYVADLDASVVVGFNPAMIAFKPNMQSELNELMEKVADMVGVE